SPLGDVTLEIGESQNPKSFTSPDIFDSLAARVGTFKAPIDGIVISSGSPIININPSRLKKTPHVATLEVSNYCIDNVISDLYCQAALAM
ncbi:unnamed protein product, partial [Citrullus colocynthis]